MILTVVGRPLGESNLNFPGPRERVSLLGVESLPVYIATG
jgi:hypothetical protein